jgi:hypothetical protein
MNHLGEDLMFSASRMTQDADLDIIGLGINRRTNVRHDQPNRTYYGLTKIA